MFVRNKLVIVSSVIIRFADADVFLVSVSKVKIWNTPEVDNNGKCHIHFPYREMLIRLVLGFLHHDHDHENYV